MIDPIRITSLDDPRIADYRNVRDADLRGGGGLSPLGPAGPSHKLFMAESEPVIRRLIESQRHTLNSLLVSEERWKSMTDVWPGFAAGGGAPVYVADINLMREIAGYRHHGGALAAGIRPTPEELHPASMLMKLATRERFCILLAEGITHVDNIGAMFRNAAAFGADGVILNPACADPLFRKAIRVSMGHVFCVRWAISEDWGGTIMALRRQARAGIIAAELHPSAVVIDEITLPARCAIVFGAERAGLNLETLELADQIVAIPMARTDTSINAAVASAVFLNEWRRGFRPSSR